MEKEVLRKIEEKDKKKKYFRHLRTEKTSTRKKAQRSYLAFNHQRNIKVHTVDKPFICQMWGKSFTIHGNVSGYSRNPCSLNRERDAALNASGTPTA